MNFAERDQLLDALIEGEISEADFLRLEAELSVDPGVRRAYYDRLALSLALETEAQSTERAVVPLPVERRRWLPVFAAVAATIAVLLAVHAVLQKPLAPALPTIATSQPDEPTASGFGVLVGQVDAVWGSAQRSLADGALIPPGRLRLESGIAHLELFSGVTVVIEGGAEFELVSPMDLDLRQGKLRARVPEAAKGFRVRTQGGQLVDLGTEFALNVSAEKSEVHVLDGEVEWHPESEAMRLLAGGNALRWTADGRQETLAANSTGFVGPGELGERRAATRQVRREDWLRFTEQMQRDPRLLGYYRPQASEVLSRRLQNLAAAGAGVVGEGAVVAAARASDRWGVAGGALDFSPTGSRVRVNVPRELQSLTLVCWVKINSLDRWYNSLFLTDGHDLGEPHWQIMDDGRLFFSVKKRNSAPGGGRDKHIFYSPPFWNPARSGQWLMLATVYDTAKRQVTHYLNGRPLSTEAVPAEYLVETVSIGNASIGNWSEPVYRTDPQFTIRNLNGSMDEFALFKAALSESEIADIYSHGRP